MTTVNFEDIKLSDEERQPCEVWTRVMGYFRPVSEFNKGKKSEFYSRTVGQDFRFDAAIQQRKRRLQRSDEYCG